MSQFYYITRTVPPFILYLVDDGTGTIKCQCKYESAVKPTYPPTIMDRYVSDYNLSVFLSQSTRFNASFAHCWIDGEGAWPAYHFSPKS